MIFAQLQTDQVLARANGLLKFDHVQTGSTGKRYGYRVQMDLEVVNAMRGPDAMQESLFMMAKLEDFVPADHPFRPIRLLVNQALANLNRLFNAIYADTECESIAPEKLLRVLLPKVFDSERSERTLD